MIYSTNCKIVNFIGARMASQKNLYLLVSVNTVCQEIETCSKTNLD